MINYKIQIKSLNTDKSIQPINANKLEVTGQITGKQYEFQDTINLSTELAI